MRNLLLLLIFGVGTTSQSAILVRAPNSEDHEKIDLILRTYTGPSPTYLRDGKSYIPEVDGILLNPEIPHAEITFIEDQFKKQNIKATVASIPSTVWNLYVASKCLKDPAVYEEYSHLVNNFAAVGYRERYFSLSAELIARLEEAKGEKDLPFFKQLANQILEEIEFNQIQAIPQYPGQLRAIRMHLLKELRKIRSNSPSIIHEVIEDEFNANRRNQILLVRTTMGLNLKLDAIEEYEKILKQHQDCMEFFGVGAEECGAPPEKPSADSQKFDEYSPVERRGKILDFPLRGSSVYSAIKDFQEKIIENQLQLIDSKGLSFADSFFAGLLFDGFNRGNLSACSFTFYVNNLESMVYTISLDKQFVFSPRGRELFYFKEGSLETDGVFGAQEAFHPRLRQVLIGKNDSNEDKIYSDSLTLEEFPQFRPDIEQDETKKKITQFVMAASQALSRAHLISGQAREAILSGQKKAARVLLKELSSPQAASR